MKTQFFSSIVVAVSGAETSIRAAKYAVVLAKAWGSRLSAVYVVDTATIKQLTLSKILIQEEGQEYERSLEADGERYLSFVEELAQAKGVKCERVLRKGAIFTEILMAADEKNADLIILGGGEKDKSKRDIILRSYGEVMINARCSVLLAKEPEIDKIYKFT